MKTKVVETFDEINFREVTSKMPMIVIYKNPTDFPDQHVARLWDLSKPTEIAVVRKTLDEIRNVIPYEFVNIGRYVNDDPVIVESWI